MQSYPLYLTAAAPSNSIASSADLFVYESATLEPRWNYVPFSERLDNGAWGKVSTAIAVNTAAGPDGTNTLDALTGTNTITSYAYAMATGFTPSDIQTVSVYFRKGTSVSNRVGVSDAALGVLIARVNIDWSGATPSVGTMNGWANTPSISDEGGGLFRLSGAFSPAANTSVAVLLYPDNNNGPLTWYAGCVQLEKGLRASPYIKNDTAAPVSDNAGDTRILVKPDNGNEIVLRPGQTFRLPKEQGKASRWLMSSFDGYSTIKTAIIIGSGEFYDANFTSTVSVSSSKANPVNVDIDQTKVYSVQLDGSGSYSASFADTTVTSGVTPVFTAAANLNGAWVELAQISVCQNSGAADWLAVALLAKATAPTGPTDGDLILFARSYSTGSLTQVGAVLPTRIKIPAGKGLYLHQVANGGAALFSTKSVLYTLL